MSPKRARETEQALVEAASCQKVTARLSACLRGTVMVSAYLTGNVFQKAKMIATLMMIASACPSATAYESPSSSQRLRV